MTTNTILWIAGIVAALFVCYFIYLRYGAALIERVVSGDNYGRGARLVESDGVISNVYGDGGDMVIMLKLDNTTCPRIIETTIAVFGNRTPSPGKKVSVTLTQRGGEFEVTRARVV